MGNGPGAGEGGTGNGGKGSGGGGGSCAGSIVGFIRFYFRLWMGLLDHAGVGHRHLFAPCNAHNFFGNVLR